MIRTLENIKEAKKTIELMREKAMTIEAELKTVSFTLAEFEAVQTGGKRQDTMRKEIQRIKRLQTQRKAEIEALEVSVFWGSFHFHVNTLHACDAPTAPPILTDPSSGFKARISEADAIIAPSGN